MICMIVANGNPLDAMRLEEEIDWVEVMRRYALLKAYNWRPETRPLGSID